MRISSFFVLVSLFVAFGASLKGQTAVEYGTITGAGATGAATDAKNISKSIGGVFDRLGKMLDKPSQGQQGSSAAPAARPAAAKKQPASSSAGKPKASRIVTPSQIRIGMSRAELLRAAGNPSVVTSGTNLEGVFAESYTYMYLGSVDTVTVTLSDGKVTGVSPMPEESIAPPAFSTPPQAHNKAEIPQ